VAHREPKYYLFKRGESYMPFLPDIPPELIDFLIEKEKREQEKQHEMPFLQLPLPEMAQIPQKKEKNEENEGIIVLDM